jgi:ABC-2 type transport system ATP-binding protein
VINIQQLQYCYQGASSPSLHNIDLSIQHQSLFGLLGPNGAGKTTLLSILSGLRHCQPGHVFIDGQDICHASSHWKHITSLVPQEYAFYNRLSVRENLQFFAGALGLDKSTMATRIDEVCEVSGLQDRLQQTAEALSGGLKRRLNLAIGLLNQPKLLLLDEPTVGIDPHSRFFILETIKQLNQQGTTVLYTSHYMEEVENLCDEIAIIDNGEVLVQGSLQSLLTSGHDDLLSLTLKNPLTTQQAQQLQAQLPAKLKQTAHIASAGSHLELRLSTRSDVFDVMDALRALNIDVIRIHYGASNLEELFLTLTQRSLRD